MTTIAIINLKGGVGKSVTTVNLAGELHRRGKRVMVVDMDKQANTTKFYGELDYQKPSVADLLTCTANCPPKVGTITAHGIFLMPANMQLLAANKLVLMDCTRPQQNRLKQGLALHAPSYDYCIIDCPPDLDMGSINALVAADWVIIPVDCDEWALDGLDEILAQIDVIRQGFNPGLRVMGGLVTKYTRTKYAVEVMGMLARRVPVFRTGIRYTVRVKEAKAQHKTIRDYEPSCTAAMDYEQLAEEVLAACGDKAEDVSNTDTERSDNYGGI